MRFYRDLVGMLDQTFAESYGSNGAIFGLPSSSLTLEIVETDHHEQLCRYCSDKRGQQAALTGLQEVATQPVEQRPLLEATGAVIYRDPDGREVVFAPFVYGATQSGASPARGKHEFRRAEMFYRTTSRWRRRPGEAADTAAHNEQPTAHTPPAAPKYSPYSADTGGLTLSL